MLAKNLAARAPLPASKQVMQRKRFVLLLYLLSLGLLLGCSPAGEDAIPEENTPAIQSPISSEITERIAEPAASMTVLGDGVEIPAGAPASPAYHTDFGAFPRGTLAPVAHAFTIHNRGNVPLTLAEILVPEGFELMFPPDRTVPPGANTIFYVRLQTGTAGLHAGEIRIQLHEFESAPFAFQIQGLVTTHSPFVVTGNGNDIPNGTLNLTTRNHTYFADDSSGFPTVNITFTDGDMEGRLSYSMSPHSGRIHGGSGTVSLQNVPLASIATPADIIVTRVFTIRNNSFESLTLNEISLPNGFYLFREPASTLAPGETTPMAVRLDTSSQGLKVGTITLSSTDVSQLPFTFPIAGFVGTPQPLPAPNLPVFEPVPEIPAEDALPPAPRVNVFGHVINIVNRSSLPSVENFTDFGTVFLGATPAVRTFTLRNTGDLPLTLERVTVPEGFAIVRQPDSPLQPGATTSFQVQLHSSSVGLKAGLLSFGHNASNLNPFAFSIQGIVRERSPVIALQSRHADAGNTPSASSDAHTDFGDVPQGGAPIVSIFTIRNQGELPLTIHSVDVPEGFTLVTEPESTVAAGQSTQFQVQLDSDSFGIKTGILRIDSNDPILNPLVHSLRGTVSDARPILSVLGNGTVIPDGLTRPELALHTLFGSEFLRQDPPQIRAFVIRNVGSLPLQLTRIDLPAGFVLANPFDSTVAPGNATTLQVQLDTARAGAKAGDIVIVSNDDTQSPFTFTIQGMVEAPPATALSVLGNQTEIPNLSADPHSGNHTDFGAHPRHANAASATHTFTIRNDGDSPLFLGSVSVPAGFILVSEPESIVQGRQDTSFQVQLDTSLEGTHAGAVFFTHNGTSLSPFAFRIQGTVAP